MSAVCVRPYQPGDESAAVGLFARAFDRTMTEEHYRWKLVDPPSPGHNVWLGLEGSRLVFQTAAIPVPYRVLGRPRTVPVVVDTMADPDRRGRGLFRTVGATAWEHYRQWGVPFILAIPNEQSTPTAVALGMRELFPLHWLIRPLRPEALVARRLRLPIPARSLLGPLWDRIGVRSPTDPSVRVQPANEAGPELDELWRECEGESAVSAIRDRAWVRWRYFEAPGRPYQVAVAWRGDAPVGWTAYRAAPDGDTFLLTDLLTKRADAGAQRALVDHLAAAARRERVPGIAAVAVPGTWTEAALRAVGFVRRGQGFTVRAVPCDPDVPLPVLRDRTAWTMTGGDFDVL